MLPVEIKSQIISGVWEAVFAHEHRELSNRIFSLLVRNHDLGGASYSFLMGGKKYAFDKTGQKEHPSKPIHPTLGFEARTLIREWDTLQSHKNRYDGFMDVGLSYCRDLQDVRDLLPNVVVDALSEGHWLHNFKRTKDPYAVFGEAKGHRLTYDGMLKIFFFYLAKRLVK